MHPFLDKLSVLKRCPLYRESTVVINIDGEISIFSERVELSNFNEISRKDVTYDNIKTHKKQGFYHSLEDTFSEKPQGVGFILFH